MMRRLHDVRGQCVLPLTEQVTFGLRFNIAGQQHPLAMAVNQQHTGAVIGITADTRAVPGMQNAEINAIPLPMLTRLTSHRLHRRGIFTEQ